MTESSWNSAETVIISCESHSRVLKDGLWNFLVTKYLVEDVECGGDVLKAHQVIFDVFLPPESKEGALTLSKDHRCHLGALLEFIYKGTVTVQRNGLDGLLQLAKDINFQMLVDAVLASRSAAQNEAEESETLGVSNDLSGVKNQGLKTKAINSGMPKRKPAPIELWEPEIEIEVECGVSAKRKRSPIKPCEPKIAVAGCSVQSKPSTTTTMKPLKSPAARSRVAVKKESGPNRKPGTKFGCSECKYESSNPSIIKSHRAVVHSGEKPVKCDKCDFVTFWQSVLKWHVGLAHPVICQHFCTICDQRFGSGTELDDHLAAHEELGTFRCPHCIQAFTQKKFLDAHVYRCHTERAPDGNFMCDVCDKWFKSRYDLAGHKLVHTGELPFPCPHCERRFNYTGQRNSHVARMHTEGGNFPCLVCGRLFALRQRLDDHQMTHTKERPFKCPHCDKCYKRERDAKEHAGKVHASLIAELRPHRCPRCPKRFDHVLKLRRHVANLHRRGSGNVACGTCGSMFKTRPELKEHQRVHAEELPFGSDNFACGTCGSMFKTHPELKEHQRVHAEELPFGSGNFACGTCGSMFKNRTILKEHQRVHAEELPFKCSQCDKRFGKQSSLRMHVTQVHGRPENQACETCGKQFKNLLQLTAHQHLHQLPHGCDECDERFIDTLNLRVHIARTHRQGPDQFACDMCFEEFKTSAEMVQHRQMTHLQVIEHRCPHCNKNFKSENWMSNHVARIHGQLAITKKATEN